MALPKTTFAEIDYGYGIARFWGPFDAETVERNFYRKANQCFGIRKSIAKADIITMCPEKLPDPWAKFPGAAWVLMHNNDIIVWDDAGDKIKSEWD